MTAPGAAPQAPSVIGLGIRAALFLLLARIGGMVFGSVLYWGFDSLLLASALSVFLAAALATAAALRIFERGRLEDVGLAWPNAQRHLITGTVAGLLAGLAAAALPVLFGLASWVRTAEPEMAAGVGKFVFVTLLLWIGAAGEELMFRGYPFQILVRRFGPGWVIPPFAVLFALAHFDNPQSNWAAVGNTALWGVVLGLAYWRSRDLWLPIGLHFGWNWALPLAGVNLSGFKMGLTGHALQWKAGPLWSGGEYGIEAGLPTTAAAVLLLAWLGRRKGQPGAGGSV
ncbi:MAG: CPBP family intramembrane glutamic endopeptidase [Acidobacteriota bacterium]